MNTELTFLDGLFANISEKGNIDEQTINFITGFMKTHQYDSDALREDLNTDNNQQSNLYNVCNQNMEFVLTSTQYTTNIDCMFMLFYKSYYEYIIHQLFITNIQWNPSHSQQDKYLDIGQVGRKIKKNALVKYLMVIQNRIYI